MSKRFDASNLRFLPFEAVLVRAGVLKASFGTGLCAGIVAVGVAVSGDALVAQFPGAGRFQTADELASERALLDESRRRDEQQRQIQQYIFPYSSLPRGAPMPFHLGYRPGLQQLFPFYEGLPTYPSNVPGYGGYPGAGAKSEELAPLREGRGLDRPPVDKDRWPSWIEEGTGAGTRKATPEQAVLARVTDRVWYRAPDEEAFVPLAFHDRFRFMTVGAEVDVRGKGEYEVVLHSGGSVRSRGRCRVAVTGMDSREVALHVSEVHDMWLQARLRPFRVTLPDGTVVRFTDTTLFLERRGDRFRVSNLGNSPAQFEGTAGKGEMPRLTFITLWCIPPEKPPIPRELSWDGDVSQTTKDAQSVAAFRGGTGGKVYWSGAAFQVPAGTTLDIRPLPKAPSR